MQFTKIKFLPDISRPLTPAPKYPVRNYQRGFKRRKKKYF